jgi:hypothetical protein
MDLIERLEKAEGPSRDLDAEIADSVKFWPPRFDRVDYGGKDRRWHDDRHGHSQSIDAPAYTASLDSAMTLVPDGWWCEAHIRPDAPGVVLWQFPLPCQRVPAERPYQIAGRTAPLALCIAALKARQTTASST